MTLKPPTGSNTPSWQRGGWENVATAHGAVPGSNCTTAVQSALSALPDDGGVIFFPAADSKYLINADSLSFDDTRSVRLVGEGGNSGGAVPASCLHVNTNGTYGLSVQSAFGFGVADLAVTYSSSFTGSVFRFGHSAAVLDSQLAAFERCNFGDGTQTSAARLFDLDKAVNVTFSDCNFTGGTRAVRGRAGSNDATQYSNMVRFFGCRFGGFTSAPVLNPGEGWTFLGCTFQDLTTDAAGAIVSEASVDVQGLSLVGCGFYDSTTTGKWVDLSAGGGGGFTMVGCVVGHAATGVDVATVTDVLIAGNDWPGTFSTKRVNYTGSGSRNVVIAGDSLGDTVVLDGTVVFKGASSQFLSFRAQNNVNNAIVAASLGGAQDTYRLNAGGSQEFGDGTNARDVSFSRFAANQWGVLTGDICARSAGRGFRVGEGSNAKQGTATLVGGTVTVSNTSVTANSRIFLTSQADGGTPGFLRVSARSAGTSFTITSSSGTDTSTVAYEIFEPSG